jgi:hypothetical protein
MPNNRFFSAPGSRASRHAAVGAGVRCVPALREGKAGSAALRKDGAAVPFGADEKEPGIGKT